jgi:hypothetical protein
MMRRGSAHRQSARSSCTPDIRVYSEDTGLPDHSSSHPSQLSAAEERRTFARTLSPAGRAGQHTASADVVERSNGAPSPIKHAQARPLSASGLKLRSRSPESCMQAQQDTLHPWNFFPQQTANLVKAQAGNETLIRSGLPSAGPSLSLEHNHSTATQKSKAVSAHFVLQGSAAARAESKFSATIQNAGAPGNIAETCQDSKDLVIFAPPRDLDSYQTDSVGLGGGGPDRWDN